MPNGTEIVGNDVFLFRDTCNVYVLRAGRRAVLVDFGSGDVLDHLADFGVEEVTDVLVTHHHRDQVQGLHRAVAAGIRVWVPPVEHDLIAHADEHWRTRGLDNDYDVRQDRYTLLRQVPVTGTVAEYRTRRYGPLDVHTLPTPGHTVGSVSYLVDIGGRRLALVGDLIHGEGRLWSLAATQWAYTGFHENAGLEGVAATVLSCLQLLEHGPEMLLPSHGEPVTDPPRAVGRLRTHLQELLDTRRRAPWNPERMLNDPWREVTPHLLRNATSMANSYALLSDHGTALLLDFGYDLTTGLAGGQDRSSRRPLLASIEALRRNHGIDRVEVALPTHYHDDHVAGFNLLREVHGTEVWSPAHIVPVLQSPQDWDLPCLWYDPIPVDRELLLDAPVEWREYEIGVHGLPGHTLYAAAYSFTADGRRVIATGDQQTTEWEPGLKPEILNYQYRNRFRIDDFTRSAELYRSLRPELMISGHWPPFTVTDAYLDMLLDEGRRLARLHREILPHEVDFGAEGFGARVFPYRSVAAAGGELRLEVAVLNPFPGAERAEVHLVAPDGWEVRPDTAWLDLRGHGEAVVEFLLRVPAGTPATERFRVGADLTVGRMRFGQQAEALVSVR
ncbi:MBL fold metallo-hydrolase [Streptomyces sp. DSM 42041]|uniref:MBL fold metallo-hydrolase n=1 Tax=Streptomyces hazeniae TaxID=3075538 RepID=A0ABU2NN90_9ACTN|nr:MBL fold metallo-hydrolase [Streptomyces sp. DSM 42041]MDT0378235.1 MBL fold metallo-hydrolase [Streptomyces sp. DSM 42041]